MNAKAFTLEIVRPLALGIGIFGASAAIGSAQAQDPCAPSTLNSFDPDYNSIDAWNTSWDAGRYDRNHILLGTVDNFSPYRLALTNASGDNMTVDLKAGTIIRPTGSTPNPGQRVAVFGYWSNGTFVANRVILHG